MSIFMEEKTIKTNYIYKGRILNLRNDDIELPDGKPAQREIVEHSGGAAILAIDGDDTVYLTRQFRYPYKKILVELPAGKLGKGENAADCARRELKEETGLVAEQLELLAELYPSPGYTEEVLYIFLAKGLHQGDASPDEDEFLQVVKLPYGEFLSQAMNNQIKDAKTVAAALIYDKKYR